MSYTTPIKETNATTREGGKTVLTAAPSEGKKITLFGFEMRFDILVKMIRRQFHEMFFEII